MDEYKKPYIILFNAYADAIEQLKVCDVDAAMDILIRAMQDAEEAYMDFEEVEE